MNVSTSGQPFAMDGDTSYPCSLAVDAGVEFVTLAHAFTAELAA